MLHGDLSTRRLTDSSGMPTTLPSLVQGDFVTFSLRLLDRVDTGSPLEVQRPIRSLRASIGNVGGLPERGQFSLRIGTLGTPTSLIDFNSKHVHLKPLLSALPETQAHGGLEHVFEVAPGCWMIRFGSEEPVPLEAAENFLWPVSFVRVRPFKQNGRWWHELRLVQAPIAYTGLSERVLADPPDVRRIREGTTYTEGLIDIIINEVQAVKVPASFRGTYYLKFEGRATPMLSPDDDATAIQTALNQLFTDGQERFSVTNPETYNAYVEFRGPLAGMPQDLLVAKVGSVEPGDLTFSLNLNTAEVFAALRDVEKVQAQFEVELEIAEPDDPPEKPGKIVTLFREPVTLIRELQYQEMAVIAGIDWLQPPQPRDYIPFTRDQIITGSQHYVAVLGNGVQRAFVLNHNLNTDALHVTVRENASGGRRIADTEYKAVFTGGNTLRIEFPESGDPPGLNSLAVTISSAGPVSAFQAHTHTMEQIVGLTDTLDNLRNRIVALETILPRVGPVNSGGGSGRFTIPILPLNEVLFLQHGADDLFGKDGGGEGDGEKAGIDAAKLSNRAPFMLPAVHTANVQQFTGLALPAPAVGKVWQNGTGGDLLLAGGGMIRESKAVPKNGTFASDGRILFQTRRAKNTVSYFPTAFERTLWNIYINEKMFGLGKTLTVEFGVATQLAKASSQAQWVLVVEKGDAPSEVVGSPNAAEINLLDVIWDTANPILKQRLILTPIPTLCYVGCKVYRNQLGELKCDRILYGGQENANAVAPLSANFALRARLIEFDTENSIPTARGWVVYQLLKPASGELEAKIS